MADPTAPRNPASTQPENVYARPIDESPLNVANNIMSTPGPQPTFEGRDLSVNGMTFREIGVGGLRAFSGFVREEVLQELQGRQGAQKYREMADNSSVVGAVLYAIKSMMRKVEWRVEEPDIDKPLQNNSNATARGQRSEYADFLEGCMNDMSHTWSDLIVENLSSLQYGYAPHEIVYKKRQGRHPQKNPDGTCPAASDFEDGKIGWRRIPIRGQDTVIQWYFSPTGAITGVRQLPWTGMMRDIGIEKMLLFRPDVHKNNPEGRSILRNAYIPYYYIKRLQEFEAIMGERMGGVPVVRVPLAMIEAANAGDAKAQASMNSFKNLAVNLRVDEQMGVVMPSDVFEGANGPSAAKQFELELVTPQGGGRGSALNFEAAITRYSTNILTSVLADFLTLGHEARGTQSLAVTKVDLFMQAIEGYLNSFAEVYNRYAVPRLFDLNGMPTDNLPKIVPDLAQRIDLDVLSNYVLRLAQAGMPLFPNEDVQTFLLDAAGMPDVVDPEAMQAAGLTPEQLDLKDETAQQTLTNLKKPQPAGGGGKPGGGGSFGKTNLDKMLLASIARRQVRLNGAVGTTKKRKRIK